MAYEEHLANSALVILTITLAVSVVSAYSRSHIPYIPIQISKSANQSPEYEIFSIGLTLGSMLLLPWFIRMSAWYGVAACLCMPFVGIISDHYAFVVHTLLATMTFILFAIETIFITNRYQWAAVIFVLMADNLVLALPTAGFFLVCRVTGWSPNAFPDLRLFLWQVRGVLQWGTIVTTGHGLYTCINNLKPVD